MVFHLYNSLFNATLIKKFMVSANLCEFTNQ